MKNLDSIEKISDPNIASKLISENDNSQHISQNSRVTSITDYQNSISSSNSIQIETPMYEDFIATTQTISDDSGLTFTDSKRSLLLDSSTYGLEYVNFCIKNVKSGKYLDIDHANTHDGANCLQWDFNGNNNQVWYLRRNSSGYYQLTPRHAPSLRLAVLNSGNNVGLKTANASSTAQDWKIVKNSRGNYVIKSRYSNSTRVLCVDASSGGTSNGDNVIQSSYTDDSINLNDEWILEPFVIPHMEYDQGFFTYHSGYSQYYMQKELMELSKKVFDIMNSEFGLKARTAYCKMISTPADDCSAWFYNCEHGEIEQCTNSLSSNHHKNFKKLIEWYKQQGKYTNGLQILWSGHPKCYNTTKNGIVAHTYFDFGSKYASKSKIGYPFIEMNKSLYTYDRYLIPYVLAALGANYGLSYHSHNTSCIMDNAASLSDIYDSIMGENPTKRHFFCDECRQTILSNITKFSKSRP